MDAFKAGSFIFKLDPAQPESIQQYKLVFSKKGYADTSLTVTYRPAGTVSIQGIEKITGETTIGSLLTVGVLKYDGTPANDKVVYQWYQADAEQGMYTAIAGANASTYTLTPEDGEKYIRVLASADEVEFSGAALSSAFGPVEKPVNVSEVFAAIEAAYLGSNEGKNNVISKLTLPTSLATYLTITWSSSNEQAITSTGAVTRDEKNDLFVTLTATLSGKASGTRSYEMIVRSVGTENVDIEGYVDPYFTQGYPQACQKRYDSYQIRTECAC